MLTNSSMVLRLKVSVRMPYIRQKLLPLCRLLGVGGGYANLLELAEVLPQ
jgi:hypothetical protein